MRKFLVGIFLAAAILFGCTQESTHIARDISTFVNLLKDNGVDGKSEIRAPINEDTEYTATYVISAYTSTRIISFFKCKNAKKAEHNLQEAMKNPKMTGQARNGTFIMAATFFPPDEDAVNKIRDLFVDHNFD